MAMLLGACLAQARPDVYHLVRLDVRGVARDVLAQLGVDVVRVTPAGELELVCNARELAAIEALRLGHHVVIADLAGYYAARLSLPVRVDSKVGANIVPPFGQGSMGGYYTYAEVVSILDQLHALFPALVSTKQSLGSSIEGRPLWAVKISDHPDIDEPEPKARFDALHHAREPESMQATLYFMLYLLDSYGIDPVATYLVDNRELWFVPVVNPDGYVYNQNGNPGGGGMWRKNRRNNGGGTFGVDLNRNYSYQWGHDDSGSSPDPGSDVYRGTAPLSEPEVQAMAAFVSSHPFATAISAHTYGGLWLYPWGYVAAYPGDRSRFDELSVLQTRDNGYPYGPAGLILYLANGVTIDYDYGQWGTLSWTPEMGGDSDGFWPPQNRIVPLAEENLEGLRITALAAGAFVRVLSRTITDADGDGAYERGETVALTLTARNSGQLAPQTSVVASLTSSSPWVSIQDGSYDFGSIAPFTQEVNDAQPLTLVLDPATPPGTPVSFTLALSYEGYSQQDVITINVGEVIPYVLDDAETPLGWTLGAAGDDATRGKWEWGDPAGTTSGSDIVQPEDDHTGGAGHNCYVTAKAGGSAGDNDVDDGKTTLISPRFNLASAPSAVLRFWRWYADLGGSPNNDDLLVQISNDDGASWSNLEVVGATENAWREVQFRVADFVAPSAQMRLKLVAQDKPNDSLCEALLDDLRIDVYEDQPLFNVFGRPKLGQTVAFHLTGHAGDTFLLFVSSGTGDYVVPGIIGHLLLDPAVLIRVFSGSIDGTRLNRTLVTIPNDPTVVGFTAYFQAVVFSTGATYLSSRDAMTIE
ncbi:MAG: M14 family zinc carboxypeptidase [Planctomycetota bacterium]